MSTDTRSQVAFILSLSALASALGTLFIVWGFR